MLSVVRGVEVGINGGRGRVEGVVVGVAGIGWGGWGLTVEQLLLVNIQ